MTVNVNLLAWVMTFPVAAIFVKAGSFKLTTPRSELLKNAQMGWIDNFGTVQSRCWARWRCSVRSAWSCPGRLGSCQS